MAQVPLLDTALFGDAALQVYYQFEGNSNDSKNSNNGTDTSVAYSAGKFGQAADFNSLGASYVSCPYLITYGDFSITFWIKGAVQSYDGVFFSFLTGSPSNQSVYIRTNGNGTGVSLIITNDSGLATPLEGVAVSLDNTWHMVSVTFEQSTNSQIIYIDGVPDVNATYQWGSWSPFDIATIGGYYTNSDNLSVDDFAIFNSVLTPTQISNLFGSTPPSNTASPSFLLNFM